MYSAQKPTPAIKWLNFYGSFSVARSGDKSQKWRHSCWWWCDVVQVGKWTQAKCSHWLKLHVVSYLSEVIEDGCANLVSFFYLNYQNLTENIFYFLKLLNFFYKYFKFNNLKKFNDQKLKQNEKLPKFHKRLLWKFHFGAILKLWNTFCMIGLGFFI